MEQDPDNILPGVPRTREALMKQRVIDLRPLARAITGPGTWISHALKEELVEAIVDGRPPRSVHATGSDIPAYFNRETVTNELEGLYQAFSGVEVEVVRIIERIIQRDNKAIIEKLSELERRVDAVEEWKKRIQSKD